MTEQQFLNSLSPEERHEFENCLKHSFSIANLNGSILYCHPPEENLFEIVLNRKRYVVDRNLNESWQATAAKPANRDKSFILGKTMSDEEYNVQSLFFGRKVRIENHNLFVISVMDWNGKDSIILERIDEHFKSVFDPRSLKTVSSEHGRKTDMQFLQWERNRKDSIEHEKKVIWLLLGANSFPELDSRGHLAETTTRLVSFIQDNARQCLGKWELSAKVARHCYALLLAENFSGIRDVFSDSDRLNVFGDTQILHNAIFLEAGILSNDRALKRMAGYTGLECVNSVA